MSVKAELSMMSSLHARPDKQGTGRECHAGTSEADMKPLHDT